MGKIILKNMKFKGRHGALAWEKSLEQTFCVDLEACMDFSRAALSDRLEDTVDYSRIYDAVKGLVEGESCQLLEKLADAICDRVLDTDERLEAVKVLVKKPGVPLDGELDWAGVEVEKKRNEG